jgi:hypothetical protein
MIIEEAERFNSASSLPVNNFYIETVLETQHKYRNAPKFNRSESDFKLQNLS